MKTVETKNVKILDLRTRMFYGYDEMTEQQLQTISDKYHIIVNRYQVFIANIQYRELSAKVSSN